jgi:hypothetical protein
MNILNGWRPTLAFPLWRVTVVFKKCEKLLQRLLEHHFYSLALYNKNREPSS